MGLRELECGECDGTGEVPCCGGDEDCPVRLHGHRCEACEGRGYYVACPRCDEPMSPDEPVCAECREETVESDRVRHERAHGPEVG